MVKLVDTRDLKSLANKHTGSSPVSDTTFKNTIGDEEMKAFKLGNDIYLRVIPAKYLFNSTMIHEVINRGDLFALRVRDSTLCIIRGEEKVEHVDHDVELIQQTPF